MEDVKVLFFIKSSGIHNGNDVRKKILTGVAFPSAPRRLNSKNNKRCEQTEDRTSNLIRTTLSSTHSNEFIGTLITRSWQSLPSQHSLTLVMRFKDTVNGLILWMERTDFSTAFPQMLVVYDSQVQSTRQIMD